MLCECYFFPTDRYSVRTNGLLEVFTEFLDDFCILLWKRECNFILWSETALFAEILDQTDELTIVTFQLEVRSDHRIERCMLGKRIIGEYEFHIQFIFDELEIVVTERERF